MVDVFPPPLWLMSTFVLLIGAGSFLVAWWTNSPERQAGVTQWDRGDLFARLPLRAFRAFFAFGGVVILYIAIGGFLES